jgi:type 1 glutamine amidotransferase
MNRRMLTVALVLIVGAGLPAGAAKAAEGKAAPVGKVYGEWRIRIRPDKGAEYDRLIEQKGLPLFREAGGRMVGWWKTLVGDLYEQVTLWEYDDMAAFQKAVEHLGKSAPFRQFVALRDPLLAGEQNQFLRLAPFAERPALPEAAAFVIHEVHRVPLRRRAAYLHFMEKEGLRLLRAHGFRPVGPWLVDVGRWTEVTYLFRFTSLAERERLMAAFAAHADGRAYGKVTELVEEISTRLLVPAPFAVPERLPPPPRRSSGLLPHEEQVAPGVHAAGFADRHGSANCGWVAGKEETLLVDLPRGVPVAEFLAEVRAAAGKPVRELVLTRWQPGDAAAVASLLKAGVERVLTSPRVRDRLRAEGPTLPPARVQAFPARAAVSAGAEAAEVLPLDEVFADGGAALYLPGQGVLFAGPLVVNGPRARLPGTDTGRWVAALRRLEGLGATRVVPGLGSWGGRSLLARQRRFLAELRRRVGYAVAQGRSPEAALAEVGSLDDYLVWMPYDRPTVEDVRHVYRELTVPAAPFQGRPPHRSDPTPHALVLIGDGPHEPGHLEEGLRPVFDATGVVPHFTVDVRALSAENLAKVRLLVILRDGLQRPGPWPKANYVWMTPAQEQAVVEFVEGGGGFLNLHNAMGLYPAGGPYLRLVGGKYLGHGPLERFRVEVADPAHAITRGVRPFSVADEQHTPAYDKGRVHLLLRSRSDGGKVAAAGWVREPGQGRLCHLAPGHTREALLHPMYQRLLRNAINWCLRRENAGAPPQRADGS